MTRQKAKERVLPILRTIQQVRKDQKDATLLAIYGAGKRMILNTTNNPLFVQLYER